MGEDTHDRLSGIEERLDRIETLVTKAVDGSQEAGSGDSGEPLDVGQARERLDELGERIEETKRRALGGEATRESEEPNPAESAEEPPAEGGEAAPEGDVRQANEAVGEGPPAPG